METLTECTEGKSKMYLPNIVGQHPLIEIAADKNADPFATGNITAFAGSASVHQVHTRSATLNSPGSSDILFQGPLLTFQAGESLAYGRFIDGTHANSDLPERYVVTGALEAKFNTEAHGITCGLFIGRLDSGSVTVNYAGKPNTITHGILLPAEINVFRGMIHAKAQIEVIDRKSTRLNSSH